MNRRQFFPLILLTVLLVAGSLVVPSGNANAGMTDYCQIPPYVIQNIPPNVLILFDISGSMLNNAYDGSETPLDPSDDHACTTSDPCTQYNAGRGYYGYFDSNQWYTYASGVFSPAGPNNTAKQSNYWSGNFLNWLTMRRIDVMRKVLTGGRPSGTKVDGQPADAPVRGLYKRVTDAQLTAYTPFTTTGNKDGIFIFNTVNSGTSKFDVYGAPNNTVTNNVVTSSDKITSQVANQSIAVNVTVPLPVAGVLQDVVGARARVGLMFYNGDEGGQVITNVGGGSLPSVINQINLSTPNTNTPLAEALWSAAGYFAQQGTISGYNSPSSTAPLYHNADYGTSNNSDPMNFGTGGSPRWPVCQKNFVLLLTDGEPCSDGHIPTNIRDYPIGRSPFQCVDNSVSPATYQSCPSLSGTGYSFPASSLVNNLCGGGGVKTSNGTESGVEDVALFMHTNDLRSSPTLGKDNIAGFQNLTLYTVFAFGEGSTLLKYASINGGFENSGPTETPTTGSPSNWDKNGDGRPDTYFEAADGAAIERAIRDAFSGILKRASSGTAASVLASGEGSGANLIQAVFYPRRSVGNDIIGWTGSLQNMWYFVDPFFANATIREDTDNNAVLHLVNDRIVQFFFDPVSQLTQVKRYFSNDNGVITGQDTTLSFENIHSLWEAGKKLWERNLSTLPRTIYTTLNGSTLIPFSVGNATLNAALLPDTGDNVTTIINYVRGIDIPDDLNLRSRTVTFGSDNNVWKLGDVVNSTPRIVASVPLNKYDTVYNDTTYKSFIDNTNYKNRGMIFTGGNDGMLHAFRLGKLELSWTGKPRVEKARITDPFEASLTPQTTLGDEQWAFIPKNALPYLKYLKDPDYCHLYYTDLAPYVFDASIGSGSGDQSTQTRTQASWRTVLIGGMRTGGACANTCTAGSDCVKTPATDVGFSSYFALDVTDPINPSLMWEFTSPNRDLGFTTTGPAVVRVNGLNGSTRDRSLNGEWYVVFGSGPTGPIDNTNNQFLGRSNQPLKFFVLNLKTGTLEQTIDTGIPTAFAGSMINSVADFNLDYQDDAVYVGYVKKLASGTTWTEGGVGRILTANTTPGGGNWTWSKLIDGTAGEPIGPVTSAVARLQNTNRDTNWLFFGAGRYFFENPATGTNTTPEIDDATGQRRLFGIKDPCFIGGTINPTYCATVSPVNFPALTNATVNTTALAEGLRGWYINLEGSSTIGTTSTYFTYDNVTRPYRAERVITDPLATTSGVVFFTTYKPYADECALGGKSFLWALRYNTGDAPSYAVMQGKALVQVSTASVEQIDLSKAFKAEFGGGMGGRRTGAIEGVPPTAQGLSLLSQPPPVKRIMHMMER
jgi:type IV pilus assembly protein PilY1